MDELITEVKTLVAKEYERATQIHGPANHSSHESYAVLKEELEEAKDEFILSEMYLDRYWRGVKTDDYASQMENIGCIVNKAILAACECIQTAAMAYKGLETIKRNEKLATEIQQAIKRSKEIKGE